MLYVLAIHYNHSGVPAVLVAERSVLGGDQVVERSQGAVAVHTEFGIGMVVVVQNLELTANRTARAGVQEQIGRAHV